MSTARIDLIVIADRANFGRVREYCTRAGPQTLERFDRSAPLAEFVVMKLKPPPDPTCQLAWGRGIGGLLSGIEQLYAGSAEFQLLLSNGSEAHLAVQRALTAMGAGMVKLAGEPIN